VSSDLDVVLPWSIYDAQTTEHNDDEGLSNNHKKTNVRPRKKYTVNEVACLAAATPSLKQD
jgi:hypothetical protein